MENSREIFHKILSITSGKDVLDCLPALCTVIELLIEQVPNEKREDVLNGVLLCITKDNKFKKSIEDKNKDKDDFLLKATDEIQKESEKFKDKIIELSEVLGMSIDDMREDILKSLEKLNLSEDIKASIVSIVNKDFLGVTH
jgi:type I restriction-modification system DNA methylase subunit